MDPCVISKGFTGFSINCPLELIKTYSWDELPIVIWWKKLSCNIWISLGDPKERVRLSLTQIALHICIPGCYVRKSKQSWKRAAWTNTTEYLSSAVPGIWKEKRCFTGATQCREWQWYVSNNLVASAKLKTNSGLCIQVQYDKDLWSGTSGTGRQSKGSWFPMPQNRHQWV